MPPGAAAPGAHQAVHVLAPPRPAPVDQERADGLVGGRRRVRAGVDQEVVGALGADDEALLTR